MPKWVADFGKSAPSTGADAGEDEGEGRGRHDRDQRRGPRDGRDQRRSFGGGGGRSDGPPRGDRRPFDKPRGPSDRDRGPRPQGDRRDDRRSFGGGGGSGGGGPRRDRDHDRGGRQGYGRGGRDDRGGRPPFEQAPAQVAGLVVHVEPESRATEAMAAMIRQAGKAYSVFDAARLVLASGERFHVKFKLGPEASTKLYVVPTDGSVWLGKEEALSHAMHGDALNGYYKAEEVELEEPKGNFASVAVCGMSGEALGPPSHHSYQTTLHKLHRERFSHLPFEEYKRRVRTDSSPEAVAKWKESQKHGMQWTWLKGGSTEGAEPKTFKSRGEMEAHFRANHAESLVGEHSEATVSGGINKRLLAPALYNHLRRAVDDARKHLLSTAQLLCGGFERHGLKLFKRRGGKLWVSRTRPRLLEGTVVLSDRIAKMVEIIKTQPGIAVKKLIEAVSPSAEAPAEAKAKAPKPAPAEPVKESAPETEVAATEVDAAPGTDVITDTAAPEAPVSEAAEKADVVAEAPAPREASPALVPAAAAQTAHHEWTGEQLHALQDLHWLNSEGYVIEYADGVVFPGVTEPPPPKPKAAPAPKEKAASAGAAGETASPDAEPESSTSDEAPTDEVVEAEAEAVPASPEPAQDAGLLSEEAPAETAGDDEVTGASEAATPEESSASATASAEPEVPAEEPSVEAPVESAPEEETDSKTKPA